MQELLLADTHEAEGEEAVTEIVPATAAEFEAAFFAAKRKGRRPVSPESTRVKILAVGEVIRFVGHEHKVPKSSKSCSFVARLAQAAHRMGWKVSIAHDGADLLVKRVK